MPVEPSKTSYYKRARFTTRLPVHYRYAPAHYWLCETEPGLLRIGMTRFATRMLGDFVESEFTVPLGERIDVGQPIGSIECFKALSEIYAVTAGVFRGFNDSLDQEPQLLDQDPYDRGWLYLVEGTLAPDLLDLDGYRSLLDTTIDKMLEQEAGPEGPKQC